jgi:transcriptional regulator with XRE-family HTH domain
LETLRHIREQAGLSQPELSELSGVAQGTISDIELDKRKPRGRTLRKLAQALGVEVADLIGEPEYPLGQAPPSPEQPPLNGFLEEERRVTSVAPSTLKEQIAFIKRLKEQREAEIEEIKQGGTPPFGWVFGLEAADSYLRKIHQKMGIPDFVEEVTGGRRMTSFEVQRLCHELSREFSDFQRLTNEARVLDHERHSDTYVEGVKGMAKIEAWMQAPESRAEDSGH